MKHLVLFLALLAPVLAVRAQGPLIPTAAPGATMKTLDQIDQAVAAVRAAVSQVEARIDLATVPGSGTYHHVITSPGSYYLSGNLGVTKANGVRVETSGVTLDLNGFEIARAAGSGGYGIMMTTGIKGISIRGGNVKSFNYGLYDASTGGLFERVSASDCNSAGLYVGNAARLLECRAVSNACYGISSLYGASLSGCTAQGNRQGGIYTGANSSLSGCTAYGNQGPFGIYAGAGSSLTGCAAHNNQVSVAIDVGAGSSLTGCTAYNNQTEYGLFALRGSVLSGCTAHDNLGISSYSYGISAADSTLIGCTVNNNSNTNAPAVATHGVGILLMGGLVRNCTVSGNRGDGIQVSSNCLVEQNDVLYNGNSGDGAGIHVIGSGNRIENNNVTNNDRGIDVDAGGNFIARNAARGNTANWDVAAGNVCLVVQAATAGAISGNSGGTAPGSTDPNANFTY